MKGVGRRETNALQSQVVSKQLHCQVVTKLRQVANINTGCKISLPLVGGGISKEEVQSICTCYEIEVG